MSNDRISDVLCHPATRRLYVVIVSAGLFAVLNHYLAGSLEAAWAWFDVNVLDRVLDCIRWVINLMIENGRDVVLR